MMPPPIVAARFTLDSPVLQLVVRFFRSLADGHFDSLDCAILGAAILGITCGMLGSFIVLRRQSLLGDAIGHAVLPGVCLGFLAAGGRNIPVLLAGAMISGLAAAVLISILERTTRLKSGECMGLVFTGFYGLGIIFLKRAQNTGVSGASGLDKLILSGQIAAISAADVVAMAVILALSLAVVLLFWRALLATSFDESFAHAIGLPVRWVHYILTVLLTVAIVVSIQAVGVVLVSAMLITPAAAAYLLTDRLYRMVALAAFLGMAGGLAGAFFSFLDPEAPSGAFMVLAVSFLFAGAFLLSPRYGLIPRMIRLWQRRRQTAAENLLHTLYRLMERRGTPDRRFGINDIASVRQESTAQVRRLARIAAGRGWIVRQSPDPIILTDAGIEEARRIARNHRLWELFLMQEANLAADHVHADAAYIEHILPPHVLARLEQMLEEPLREPHPT